LWRFRSKLLLLSAINVFLIVGKILNTSIKEQIIDKATCICGGSAHAVEWYKKSEIPSFSMTAEELVGQGKGHEVLAYLDRMYEGGYA